LTLDALKGHKALWYANRAVLCLNGKSYGGRRWYHRIEHWQLPIGCQ